MLQAEGDADNRNATDQAENSMRNCQLHAAEDQPKDIQQQRGSFTAQLHIPAKGEKAQTSQLKALQAHRYANNSYTPKQTHKIPDNTGKNTSQNKPENVANYTHCALPFANLATPLSTNNKCCYYHRQFSIVKWFTQAKMQTALWELSGESHNAALLYKIILG